jgi:L-rhamnose mutarotase
MILFGPSPKDIIEPISKDEFLESVKKHAESWDKWVEQMKNPFAQSYAIFSLCRALYTIKTGEQVSKKQAALWVEKEYPKWSNIIQKALKWRFEGKYKPPDEINFPTTVAFVHFARSEILKTFI